MMKYVFLTLSVLSFWLMLESCRQDYKDKKSGMLVQSNADVQAVFFIFGTSCLAVYGIINAIEKNQKKDWTPQDENEFLKEEINKLRAANQKRTQPPPLPPKHRQNNN